MKKSFFIVVILALAAVCLTYSNHFNNAFHFDDSHTIENNLFIRDMKNLKLFFTSAETHSSIPQNQSYRPMHTLSVAIDYQLGGKELKPFYFHLHNFVYYLVQLILMFFLILKIAEHYSERTAAKWTALAAVLFYGLHTANAETINYISARTDSFSTTWMLASMCIYCYFPSKRKFFFYLLPFVVSFLFKPVTIVLPVLLFLYTWFFEKQKGFRDVFNGSDFLKTILTFIPLGALTAGLYLLQSRLTAETFTPGAESPYHYIISQPFVLLHYVKNFFLPTDLSADTDWKPLPGTNNWMFWTGFIFIVLLLYVIARTSSKPDQRPISYGLIWFLLTLLPTSLVPLAEVLNDHRPFLPYIGLLISFSWTVYLLLRSRPVAVLRIAAVFYCLLISAYAYGTFQRNKVWHDGESLWKDVTEKSPANGRGWMNYGLIFMARGDYAGAEQAFNKSLQLLPDYSYLHINLAILYDHTNRKALAEKFFNKALLLNEVSPDSYYYFAEYLYREKRPYDAKVLLERGLAISPAHIKMRYLLMKAYADLYDWEKLRTLCNSTLQLLPNDGASRYYLEAAEKKRKKSDQLLALVKQQPTAGNYLNLSLEYYNEKNYEACIAACNEALRINPAYALAYSNSCIAYTASGDYDRAVEAGKKAVQLDPGNQLAKNNLALAQTNREKFKAAEANAKAHPNADNYINLSLDYYNAGNYPRCIAACEKALKFNPESEIAYNNLCIAYTMLKNYDKAIAAGEKAVKLKPDFALAKNNLNLARQGKQAAQ